MLSRKHTACTAHLFILAHGGLRSRHAIPVTCAHTLSSGMPGALSTSAASGQAARSTEPSSRPPGTMDTSTSAILQHKIRRVDLCTPQQCGASDAGGAQATAGSGQPTRRALGELPLRQEAAAALFDDHELAVKQQACASQRVTCCWTRQDWREPHRREKGGGSSRGGGSSGGRVLLLRQPGGAIGRNTGLHTHREPVHAPVGDTTAAWSGTPLQLFTGYTNSWLSSTVAILKAWISTKPGKRAEGGRYRVPPAERERMLRIADPVAVLRSPYS